MAVWYYRQAGRILGPFQPNELRDLIQSGAVTPQTAVAIAAGDALPKSWVPASKIKGVQFPVLPLPLQTSANVVPARPAPLSPPPIVVQAPPILRSAANDQYWARASDREFAASLRDGEVLLSVHRRSFWKGPLFGGFDAAVVILAAMAIAVLMVTLSESGDTRPDGRRGPAFLEYLFLIVLIPSFLLLPSVIIQSIIFMAKQAVLRITNRRAVLESGIFVRNQKQIKFEEARAVVARRSFLQRCFQCGRVVVFRKDRTQKKFVASGFNLTTKIAEGIRELCPALEEKKPVTANSGSWDNAISQ